MEPAQAGRSECCAGQRCESLGGLRLTKVQESEDRSPLGGPAPGVVLVPQCWYHHTIMS